MSLPVHLTGMENIKGQQQINAVFDSINNEIDTHKWTVTTQDYTNIRFEKYIESGSTLTVDQKPQVNVPIVGLYEGRKVYIGDLDVQGNLKVKDLSLRANVTVTAKSWEMKRNSGITGDLVGTWWDSESFRVGIREPKGLTEVASILNDIKDPVYGETITNELKKTPYNTWLDTKTFEKVENSFYISYGYYNIGEAWYFCLNDWINTGRRPISRQTYFPQITTNNAAACWAPNQIYGIFTWENGDPAYLTFHSYTTYKDYETFYQAVSNYKNLHGESGTGIMIPSWRYCHAYVLLGGSNTTMKSTQITTRRFISEKFDKRNSGIIKVDQLYRI